MADTDDDAPSFLEKQRAARPWLDHLVRAAGRFQEQKATITLLVSRTSAFSR